MPRRNRRQSANEPGPMPRLEADLRYRWSRDHESREDREARRREVSAFYRERAGLPPRHDPSRDQRPSLAEARARLGLGPAA